MLIVHNVDSNGADNAQLCGERHRQLNYLL